MCIVKCFPVKFIHVLISGSKVTIYGKIIVHETKSTKHVDYTLYEFAQPATIKATGESTKVIIYTQKVVIQTAAGLVCTFPHSLGHLLA
jgi:hypothetical protein